MNKIILILIICGLAGLFTGCSNTDSNTKHFTSLKNYPKSKKIMARLTTYSVNEKRGDKWTRKKQSSTGIRLKENFSAAVDPRIIPYYSKVLIPELDLELFAHDTGSAVKSRLASRKTGRNEPIIDIFFNKEIDAKKFRLNNPAIVEVLIVN